MATTWKKSTNLQKSVLIGCLNSILTHLWVQGASTTMGDLFFLQLPYLQEPGGHVVASLVTSWNRPFTVKVSTPHLLGPLEHVLTLYRMETVSVDLWKMFSFDCDSNRQNVEYVTIRSDRGNMFAVIVCVMDNELSIETFPALPVAAYGSEYYIATFDFNPFIVLIVPTDWRVDIVTYFDVNQPKQGCHVMKTPTEKLVQSFPRGVTIYESCNRTTLPDRGKISKYDVFCSDVTTPTLSFTGVLLKAHMGYYGVISGNTRTFINRTSCKQGDLDDEAMVAAFEPVLPTSWYGTEYILPDIQFNLGTRLVRAAGIREPYRKDAQIFRITIVTNEEDIVRYVEMNAVFMTELPSGHHKLVASAPVQCHYVVYHSCLTPGSIAYSVLVPFDRGYFSYIWTSPDNHNFQPLNFVLIVVKVDDLGTLLLDKSRIDYLRGYNVSGAPDLIVLELSVSSGAHDLYSDAQAHFLCYLFGAEGLKQYLHPAGYLVSGAEQACTKTAAPMDLVDDDCDGRLDEEILDGIDNDNDYLIDEDLKRPVRAHGDWSEWSEWACPASCDQSGSTTLVRTRSCRNMTVDGEYCFGDYSETNDEICPSQQNCSMGYWSNWGAWECPMVYGKLSPPAYEERRRTCEQPDSNSTTDCVGFSIESKKSKCDKVYRHPLDCPVNVFGLDCNNTCENCPQDCDKYTGFCYVCKLGFYNRSFSCRSECPAFTYGEFCQGNCPEKCNADCVNRTTGECPHSPPTYTMQIVLIILPLTIIPIITLCYLVISIHSQILMELEDDDE